MWKTVFVSNLLDRINEFAEVQPTNTVSSTNPNDIRLKENFKVFISGPSRCGKTVFVSNLLEKK